jgi:hypothetical protein
MLKEPVLYTFHYDNNVFRVQQIRNMGPANARKVITHSVLGMSKTNLWQRLSHVMTQ